MEVKFRAWDDVAKRMSYGEMELFDDMLGFRFEHFETGKPIFMQYTGLFDDEGNEIYEGDIVEVTEMKTPPHRAVVHFNYKGAWITANPLRKELGFSHIQSLFDYCDFEFGRGITSTCRVIGNIFEHPHLLGGEEE